MNQGSGFSQYHEASLSIQRGPSADLLSRGERPSGLTRPLLGRPRLPLHRPTPLAKSSNALHDGSGITVTDTSSILSQAQVDAGEVLRNMMRVDGVVAVTV